MDSTFSSSGRWFFGGFLAILGLVALYLAAHIADGGFYLHGLLLFALCVAGIFYLIGAEYDSQDLPH